MKTKSMNLSWIVVKDLKEAIKFYTEVLGLELKTLEEQWGWAELGAPEGTAKLGLAQSSDREPMKPGSNAVVTFKVDDIEAASDDLRSQGVKLEGEVIEVPGEVKLQTFKDASGNTFQLVEMLR